MKNTTKLLIHRLAIATLCLVVSTYFYFMMVAAPAFSSGVLAIFLGLGLLALGLLLKALWQSKKDIQSS